MPFLNEFCAKVEAYANATLVSATDRPGRDTEAARLMAEDAANIRKRAEQEVWDLLQNYGFSADRGSQLPDLQPLGITEENRRQFLEVVDWLFQEKDGLAIDPQLFRMAFGKQIPQDVEFEEVRLHSIDGVSFSFAPLLAIEDLTESIGQETLLSQSIRAKVRETIECEQQHADLPEASATDEPTVFKFDLRFDVDGARVWRDTNSSSIVEEIPEKAFKLLYEVARYLTENPDSSVCPNDTLFEYVWDEELKPHGATRTGQLDKLHHARHDANCRIRPMLQLELKAKRGKGCFITDELNEPQSGIRSGKKSSRTRGARQE